MDPRLTVAVNQDGRLEAFVIGPDGDACHIWQVAPNSAWSGWANLVPGWKFTGLAVGSNVDGRLEAFLTRAQEGGLYHRWQGAPNSGWKGWGRFGDPDDQAARPSVARNVDGRLEYVAINPAGGLWRAYQKDAGTDHAWVGPWWHPGSYARLVIRERPSGQLQIFAQRSDGNLMTMWQVNAATDHAWSDWMPVGNRKVSDLAVVANPKQAKRLEVFSVSDAGVVGRDVANGDGFSGGDLPGLKALAVDAACNLDGRMEAFALGADKGIHHNWETTPGGRWSGWNKMPLQESVVALAAARNKDGRLECFALSAQNELWHAWQLAQGGWSAWEQAPPIIRQNTQPQRRQGRQYVTLTDNNPSQTTYIRGARAPDPDYPRGAKIVSVYATHDCSLAHTDKSGRQSPTYVLKAGQSTRAFAGLLCEGDWTAQCSGPQPWPSTIGLAVDWES